MRRSEGGRSDCCDGTGQARTVRSVQVLAKDGRGRRAVKGHQMDILSIFCSFKTQEQCLAYLEEVRWRGEPACIYCGSLKVCRHASGDRANQRWQCQDCHKAFSVTVGTIFHRTHMPLQTWFMVLALMLNAKKSASACQIARDVGVRRATVWSMMHRVRVAMAGDQNQRRLLCGIVEADETFIGGKGKKPNKRRDEDPQKRRHGRGTAKTPILGAVERGGRVVAEPVKNTTGRTIEDFINRRVDKAGTLLMTDEWGGYNRVGKTMNQRCRESQSPVRRWHDPHQHH